MKIKRLELTGFKSFVDKTIVEFPDGITSIVGPNGCGKSNIVDAIRWVLGEQSSKNLRGKSMEDVIFNGSEDRPPTGMAEIVLIFDNADGRIGGPFANYTEISVGRRLFRSGESEYLINKMPARLRDIQEIFMDTGVGTRAHYSIIEQGKIGMVISAKPEDRRILIEEVAGISKYRIRKESALRKIDSTKQNLLRVSDVIGEVKRQMDYTHRQAQKAKRHVTLKDEALALEARIWKVDYREERSKLDSLNEQEAKMAADEIGLKAQVGAADNRMEQLRLETLDAEKNLQGIQANLFGNKSRIGVLENDLEHFKTSLAAIGDSREGQLQQVEKIKEQVALSRGQLEDGKKHLEEIRQEDRELSDQLSQAEHDLRAADGEVMENENSVESNRDQLNGFMTQIANGGTTLDNLDRRRIDFKGRLAKSEAEKGELEKRTASLEQVLEKNRQKLHGTEQMQLELQNKTQVSQENVSELTQKRSESEGRLQRIRERLSTFKSQLNILEEIQHNYEGLQEGVRSIMLKRKSSAGQAFGVQGLVAELIALPKKYEQAAEAVLGERLQYIVVHNQTEGVQAIDYLTAESAGRSSFIPMALKGFSGTDSDGSSLSSVRGEGVIGPMLDLVDTDSQYRDIVRYLFGNVVVVDNLKHALEIWSRNGIHHTLVTLDGEVVDPFGVVSGGRQGKADKRESTTDSAFGEEFADASSLLRRRRVIEDLQRQTAQLQIEQQEAQASGESLTKRLHQTKVEVESLQRDRHQEELRAVKQQKDLVQIEEEQRRCQEALSQVLERKAEEEASLREVESEEERMGQVIRQAKEDKNRLGSDLDQLKENAVNLKVRLQTLKDKVLQLQVRAVELREQKAGRLKEVERLELDIREREEHLTRALAEINRCAEEENDLKEKRVAAEREIKERIERNQAFESESQQKRSHYDEQMERVRQTEENLRQWRKQMDEVSSSLNAVRVKNAEAKMRVESLEDQARERQNIALDVLIQEAMSQEVVPGDAAGEEGLNADMVAEIRERLADLYKQLEGIGEVNLASIAELEELTQRHLFLNRQKEDLENSIDKLQRTIHKVNRTSRERFRETFDAVNAKFQSIFPRLFGGGKASLILTDENDLLETGVDLLCQPPGKKIQNVTLLSGGEKALASICLILGIFLIRPSPFCLLDEVDAPLDDANISRFNDLLHELSQESQLILITHNRHTMEIANYLYGVTMEEPGVSRMVSVRMN